MLLINYLLLLLILVYAVTADFFSLNHFSLLVDDKIIDKFR